MIIWISVVYKLLTVLVYYSVRCVDTAIAMTKDIKIQVIGKLKAMQMMNHQYIECFAFFFYEYKVCIADLYCGLLFGPV